MAVRFRFPQQNIPGMPVSPLAQAFATLAQAYMSGPSQFEVDKLSADTDLARLKGEEYRRAFAGNDEAAGILGGSDPYSIDAARRAMAAMTRGGRSMADVGQFGRVFTFNVPGADQGQRDRAYVGAGGQFSGTETGFQTEDATRRRGQDVSAGATIQAARIGAESRERIADMTDKRSMMPVRNRGGGDVIMVPKSDYQPLRHEPVLPSSYFDKGAGPNGPVFVLPSTAGTTPAYDRPPAEGTRSEKIATLVRQGISPEDSAAIVDGTKKIQVSPTDGRVFITDLRDQTVKELPIQPAPSAPPAAPPALPPTSQIQTKMSDTTGVVPSIAETLSRTLGQVAPQTFGSPEITRNRQNLGIIGELAVDALLKNSRAPVAEQERIRKLLPTTGVFTSATEATTKLTELRELTIRRIDADRQLLSAPMVSRAARQEAEERIRKSELLLQEIDRFAGGSMATPTEGADPLSQARDAIRRGADPGAVRKRLQEMGVDPSGL